MRPLIFSADGRAVLYPPDFGAFRVNTGQNVLSPLNTTKRSTAKRYAPKRPSFPRRNDSNIIKVHSGAL